MNTFPKTHNIQELIDFILENGPIYRAVSRIELWNIIQKHIDYGTCFSVRRHGRLIAVVRYNWMEIDTVHFLDVIVDKKHRTPKFLKLMLLNFKLTNPQTKYITWQRKKHNYRWSLYTANQMLRGLKK